MKKLVHTADLHLGAKLHEKDRLDEQVRLLDWLCGVLARERPDALVLAGDLFDVYYPPSGVQRVWYDFLARVRGEGLARSVVAVAGNHDSPSALGCSGRVLGLIGAHLLAGDTGPAEEAFAVECADGGKMAFAALPFLREGLLRTEGGGDAARGFAAHASAAVSAARGLAGESGPVVAVAHCTARGAALSDATSERGRRWGATGGVDAVGLEGFAGADYVALGHLHIPQTVGGRDAVRYAGSPLAMSFSEASGAKKGVCVAEFDGGGGAAPRVRVVEAPVYRALKAFSGTREEILASATAWKPEGGGWASVSVTGGDGSFEETCEAVRAVLEANGAELACNTDDRRRGGGGGAAAGGESVETMRAVTPLSLAMERLSEEHLSGEELEEYGKMLEEIGAGEETGDAK